MRGFAGALFVLVLAWSAVGAAGAGAERSGTLRYRLAGAGWDLGASGSCPDGSVRYDIVSTRGRRIGTATTCVLAASKQDAAGGAVLVSQRVLETDAFAGGWLRTRSTQLVRNASDGRRATIAIRGTVAGGTRGYRNARGTVTGSGTRRGDTIDVAVIVRLE
jgi:hypothetical protein